MKLNKLENQRIYPATVTYNLGEQLCECLLSFESAWEEKHLAIETDVEEEVMVNTDAELLSLVWNNLFSNAVKFTEPHGRIFLSEIGGGFSRCPGNGYRRGIPSEVGKHIFEKFYQGDTSHAVQGNRSGTRPGKARNGYCRRGHLRQQRGGKRKHLYGRAQEGTGWDVLNRF